MNSPLPSAAGRPSAGPLPSRPAVPLGDRPAYPSGEGLRLRVLVAHNAYQQRGGEDSVVESEVELLLKHGHAVERYTRHNSEISNNGGGAFAQLKLARDALWSQRSSADITRAMAAFRPDVIHVHNSFPLISPSLYWAAAAAGVPVVQTLHNFRLICPQAMLLREGRVCESCVGKVPWRGVVHGCYRGSVAQSAVVATMVQTHRALGTWQSKVTMYIALNEFCKRKFIEGGLPAGRLRIKPNFVDLPALPVRARSGYLFVGRLSAEKGVQVLAQAMAAVPPGTTLRVAGSGPEQPQLDGVRGVHLLGALAAPAIQHEMAGARALVLPSIWYENFPRTLVEAFANGLPVIASRLGAMAELVEDGVTGLLFEPGNSADLAAKLAWAEAHPEEMARMGQAAQARHANEWTGQANHRLLLAIYAEAISSARSQGFTSAGTGAP